LGILEKKRLEQAMVVVLAVGGELAAESEQGEGE
jgi:hypothetical protein